MSQMNVSEQTKQGAGHNHNGMKPLAGRLQRHHTLPAPETAVPRPIPFPQKLWIGLWSGVVAGAVVGLLFGRLLFTGVIAPRGWEAIFSLGPFTFHFFWTMMGVALGMLVGGVGAVLATESS